MKRVLIYGWFGENNVGDELLLKTMLELLSNNSEIEPYVICSNPMGTCVNILKPNTLWDTLEFVKQQDCIVGMRYHSLVLSILMKKYFIPIIYHPKSAELCKEYGIEDYAVSVGNGENWIKSNISAIDIRNKIKRLEKDKKFIDHNLEVLAQKRKCNIEKEIIRNL